MRINVMNMVDFEKLQTNLSRISLTRLTFALGVSFLTATGISVYVGYLMFPNKAEKINLPPKILTADNGDTTKSGSSLTPAEIDRILKRNIFNSEGKLGDQTDEGAKGPVEKTEKPVKSDLPLRLLGVIFGGNPYNGLALIENKEKSKTNSFIVGEIVDRGAILTEIYPDRIIVDRQGRKEFILIERVDLVRSKRVKKTPGVATKKDDKSSLVGDVYKEEGFERKGFDITISDTYKQNLLTDKFTDVLQDAKAEPNMVGGELKGFRLVRIREGSIYQKSGFQNGDVVTEINGIPLQDAAGAIQLLNSLRTAKNIDVRLDRAGQIFTMNIGIQ